MRACNHSFSSRKTRPECPSYRAWLPVRTLPSLGSAREKLKTMADAN